MSYNSRRITQQFHRNNYTKINLLAFTNTSNMNFITEYININESKRIISLKPGVYCVFIGDIYYIFTLCDTVFGNDYIVLNKYNSYSVINGKKKPIRLFKYMRYSEDNDNPGIASEISNSILEFSVEGALNDSNNKINDFNNHLGSDNTITSENTPSSVLEFPLEGVLSDSVSSDSYRLRNTVNTIFDSIVLDGNTTLDDNNRSPYKPTKITSISNFVITTKSSNSREYSLTINIKNNIKKLPSGICDTFVIDSYYKRAFIIYRIGRLILTGNEEWALYNKKDKFYTFFLKYDTFNTGEDDTSLLCNYFPTISNTDIKYDTDKTYAISNSNDESNRGIYVRMPKDLISDKNDPIESFKDYIREAFKTNPIIVEYLLKNEKYKSVLLDEYCIKQFYPYTDLSISYPTKVICLSRVQKK